ncbi:MAG: tagatose 1,6-diphosphate aldolase [Anaerolineae bacterium]
MKQTTGKIRRLQQCASPEGMLVIMAMDHRNNLRRALDPQNPSAVPDQALSAFKQEVVAALAPASSAVLLDPEYGAGPCIASGALPGDTGLILALERTGYTGDPAARESELLPGWNPQRALQIGASGVKLLVYYHPQAPTAPNIENLVRRTANACTREDMPLFLEPLTYSPSPERSGLSPDERRHAVIETARKLTAIPGVDVLKVEFPLDTAAERDQGRWLAACRELTEASRVPWVLLSAGIDFEGYLQQVIAATRAGARGVAAGRAVWKEATGLAGTERAAFLRTTARERMERIAALCRALGE